MGLVSVVWGVIGILALLLLIVWIFSGNLDTGRKLARKLLIWIAWGFVLIGLGILVVSLLLLAFSWIKGFTVNASPWSKEDWSSLGSFLGPLLIFAVAVGGAIIRENEKRKK